MDDDTIDQIVVSTVDLDVVAIPTPTAVCGRFWVDACDSRGKSLSARLTKHRLYVETPAPLGKQVPAHRRVHVLSDELLEPLCRWLIAPDDRFVVDLGEMCLDPVAPTKIRNDSLASGWSHRLNTDRDASAVLMHSAQIKAAVIHVPDGECQGTQGLQVGV